MCLFFPLCILSASHSLDRPPHGSYTSACACMLCAARGPVCQPCDCPSFFLPPRCFLIVWYVCSQQGLAAQFQVIDGNIVSAWILYSLHGHPLCYCYCTTLSAECCSFFSPLVSQISQCTVITFDLWIVWTTMAFRACPCGVGTGGG